MAYCIERKRTVRNTAKDLLLPNTVSQKDEKPHTSGLDDTAIPHIKIKITEIPLIKRTQYRNTVNPNVPLEKHNLDVRFTEVFISWGCPLRENRMYFVFTENHNS